MCGQPCAFRQSASIRRKLRTAAHDQHAVQRNRSKIATHVNPIRLPLPRFVDERRRLLHDAFEFESLRKHGHKPAPYPARRYVYRPWAWACWAVLSACCRRIRSSRWSVHRDSSDVGAAAAKREQSCRYVGFLERSRRLCSVRARALMAEARRSRPAPTASRDFPSCAMAKYA